MDKKPYVIGITGGIASGKSAVSGMLESLGAYIIDADVVSREIVAKGTDGEKELRAAFPFAFKSGELDRKALREHVFSDGAELDKLNAITQPLIRTEIERKISACGQSTVFLVVPLLFETGYDALCDCVVTVAASEPTRIARLIKRDNITEEHARKILRAQASEAERANRADVVLVNDDGLDGLTEQVRALYQKVTSKKSRISH